MYVVYAVYVYVCAVYVYALYAYRSTRGPSGLLPYLCVFGQQPWLPRSPVAPQTPGERLTNLLTAVEVLTQYRKEENRHYLQKESPRAQSLGPGDLVTLRVKCPRKGTPKWQPGYQVVSSRGPALVLRDLATGKSLRANQANVRLLPETVPYQEVDPLPAPVKRPVMNLQKLPDPFLFLVPLRLLFLVPLVLLQ